MHDPMVVAHEIPFPLPRRIKWREAHYKGRRWGFTRVRGTGPDNKGKPVYHWWRPTAWTFALGGRVYGLRHLATIWHVEPKGHDSGDVCRHYVRSTDARPSAWRVRLSPFLKAHQRRNIPSDPAAGRAWISDSAWKWHVHHWRIQIPWLQAIRSRLFDRCTECGRKGRPNVSHSWEGKRLGWWKFKSREGLYHMECSNLVQIRRQREEDEATICELFAAFRVLTDMDEEEAVNRLFKVFQSSGDWTAGWRRGRRVASLLGYDMRESDARYVKAEGRERTMTGMLK